MCKVQEAVDYVAVMLRSTTSKTPNKEAEKRNKLKQQAAAATF